MSYTDDFNEKIVDMYCKKCGYSTMNEEDKYCRRCGSYLSKRSYFPSMNMEEALCVYGPPPIKIDHSCPKCGNSWFSYEYENTERFCPKCGSLCAIRELGYDFDPFED